MPIIKNINELNERIIFQTKEPNPGPEPGETVIDLFSCWAHVRTQNIKDVKAAMGTRTEDTVDIVIRYKQPYEVDNRMVIKWRSHSYEIVQVNPDTGFKEFNVIVARKLV